MKISNLILWVLLLTAVLMAVGFVSCGGGDDDDDDTVAGAGGDDDDLDNPDDDDDFTGDDDDSSLTWVGEQVVYFATYDGKVPVHLDGLDAFEWTDPDDGLAKAAVLLSTVAEQAFSQIPNATIDPAGYRFNFVSGNGDDILEADLGGDFRGLPDFAAMEKGWFVEYEEETPGKFADVRVAWDSSLGYEDFMNARKMNGGTISMVEELYFDKDVSIDVSFSGKAAKGTVNLNGLPAFMDGADLSVMVNMVVLKAGLSGFDAENGKYVINFITNADGGNESLLTNLGDDQTLLPKWDDLSGSKDIHHGWLKDTVTDGYGLFWDPSTGYSADYDLTQMDNGSIVVYDVTPAK
jgi:hypothetical protein